MDDHEGTREEEFLGTVVTRHPFFLSEECSTGSTYVTL